MKSIIVVSFLLLVACDQKAINPKREVLQTPTKSLLQAISQVDKQTVWISGHDATIIKSTDGGASWKSFSHPTGDTLQFRDIHAFDNNKAVVMSAGSGPLSRIFTFSGDANWKENFVMQDSLGFLDCIDFWDAENGIAYGDAIDDYPYILLTSDGGNTWERAPTDKIPTAGKGEGGFAASGTCVTTGENGSAWIATGAAGNCRVLITQDYGKTWNEADSPLIRGEAAGNTSVSFIGKTGLLVGGDLAKPDQYTDNTAFSKDGGKSWSLSQRPKTPGSFYGGAITTTHDRTYAFACGPSGLDYTVDLGQTWSNLDTLNYWAVSFHENIGFVSGRDGQVLKITLQ